MNYYNINGNIEEFDADLTKSNGFIPLTLTDEQLAYMISSQSKAYDDVIRLGVYPQHVVTADELINQIYTNYEKAETSNITAAGIWELDNMVTAGNPKAIAVMYWLSDLYIERDEKLGLVEGGDLTVNVNPSQPIKPYSFREMKIII